MEWDGLADGAAVAIKAEGEQTNREEAEVRLT